MQHGPLALPVLLDKCLRNLSMHSSPVAKKVPGEYQVLKIA